MKNVVYEVGQVVRVRLDLRDIGWNTVAVWDGYEGEVTKRTYVPPTEDGTDPGGYIYELKGAVSEKGVPYSFADAWLRKLPNKQKKEKKHEGTGTRIESGMVQVALA